MADISSVAAINQAVASPSVARVQGAGKAYQAVAQSTALAVQDSVDYFREVSMVGFTTIGVAAAYMIATQQVDPWKDIIKEAQAAVDAAAGTITTVGTNAGQVLSNFPSG